MNIPTCSECGSKQIRTTQTHEICVSCGHRKELNDIKTN